MDWTDGSQQVTEHFTVSDCLTLHAWGRLATEADGADFEKLLILCQKLEQIRAILNVPMNIHCMFRSKPYNIAQGILLPTGNDVHAMNLACDFDAGQNLTTDEVKAKLLPELENLGIRMENNGPGAGWVHVDMHPIISNRFFNV